MEITLPSKFNRSAELLSYSQNGEFLRVARSYPCTWQWDTDTTKVVSVPPDFRGAVLEHYQHFTQVKLLGFTPEELAAPTPVQGWNREEETLTTWHRVVETNADYLSALATGTFVPVPAEGGDIHPISGNRRIELEYCWGAQEASHFAVISPEGEILRQLKAVGEYAPIPLAGEVGVDWEFTTQSQLDWEAERAAEAAFERGRSPKWEQVSRSLRAAYNRRENPLKGLRARFGGEWTYHTSAYRIPAPKAEEVRFEPSPTGGGWVVCYVPAGM